MEREEAKFGVADASKFKPVDGNGAPTFIDGAIVPIMKQHPDGKWDLIGTGFFITTNGVLATAKHVLTDILDEKGQQLYPLAIFHFLPGDIYLKRPIIRFTVHKNADVGVAIVAPEMDNKAGKLLTNKTFSLSTSKLEIDDIVFTYAYPNTVHVSGEIQQIHFNPRYYEGKVDHFYQDGRDKTLLPSPCYQTSIAIHGGASGGPVFDIHGSVRGINSTAFPAFPDVSFISRVEELLPLSLTDVSLQPGLEPCDISVDRLAELGHITVNS